MIESALLDRVSKFKDEIQFRLKVISEEVHLGARTDKQDDEVKKHELCATVLDQNEGSNMVTSNQTQDDIGKIVKSVVEPCVSNRNLEIKGDISN